MTIKTMSNKEITKESYQATAEEFARNVANLAPMASIEKFIKLLPLKLKSLILVVAQVEMQKYLQTRG